MNCHNPILLSFSVLLLVVVEIKESRDQGGNYFFQITLFLFFFHMYDICVLGSFIMKTMNISLSSMYIFYSFVIPECTHQGMFLIELFSLYLGKQAFLLLLLLAFFPLEVSSNFFQMFVILMEKSKNAVKENKTTLYFICFNCFKTISTIATYFVKSVNSSLVFL